MNFKKESSIKNDQSKNYIKENDIKWRPGNLLE